MARRRADQQQATGTTGTLVAAAARINLNDLKLRQGAGPKPAEWQRDAWAYFDEVPEVKFAVRFSGNAFAKLKLFAAVRPRNAPADQQPIPVAEDSSIPPEIAAAAEAEVARLKSQIGGQASLQARLNMNFEIAGECWLVGWGAREQQGDPGDPMGDVPRPASSNFAPAQGETWQVCSISEVRKKSGAWTVYDTPGDKKGRTLDPSLDTIIRLWEQHPQWSGLADTAMRGVLNDCKALQVFSQQQYAEGLSRQSAGLLLLPNGLDTGTATPTEPEDEPAVSPFMEKLMRGLVEPIEDPSSTASVVPTVIKGNREDIAAVTHLLLGRQSDDSLDKRMQARIERIARGLNLPVEVVMGHQATTYANAEQIDQDTFEDFLQPRCVLVVDSLTIGFLQPNLRESFPDPGVADAIDRVCVWYDPGAIVRQPDTEHSADSAYDRMAISSAAYRKARGFNEDDAPDALEMLIRVAMLRGRIGPELADALLVPLADEAGITLPDPSTLSPGGGIGATSEQVEAAVFEALIAAQLKRGNGRRPGRATLTLPAASVTAARARPTWNPGRDLMQIDRDLRTRLIVAADASMTRALEKAGAKMRAKAGKDLRAIVQSVDNLHVAATLGPHVVAGFITSDDLLDGAWDGMEQQFMTWGATAQAQALDIASRAVSGLSDVERADLQLRQASDLAEAWTWTQEAMTALAHQVMFNPDPTIPEIGEFDASARVPAGLLRQAVSRAGGAGGLVMPQSGGAYVTLRSGGNDEPAGGIGTGELIGGVLLDNGASVEAYEWVYGPAFRSHPFEPHVELDGVQFENFDDPVLANGEGFPDFDYFMPGDHDGCMCDVEPIILPAAEG